MGTPAVPPSQPADPGSGYPEYTAPPAFPPTSEARFAQQAHGMEQPTGKRRRFTTAQIIVVVVCILLVAISTGLCLFFLGNFGGSKGTTVSAISLLNKAKESTSAITTMKVHCDVTSNAQGHSGIHVDMHVHIEGEEEKTPNGIMSKEVSKGFGSNGVRYRVGDVVYQNDNGHWTKFTAPKDVAALSSQTELDIITPESILDNSGVTPKVVAENATSYTLTYTTGAEDIEQKKGDFTTSYTFKVSKATNLVTEFSVSMKSKPGRGAVFEKGTAKYIDPVNSFEKATVEYNVPVNIQVPPEALNAPDMGDRGF